MVQLEAEQNKLRRARNLQILKDEAEKEIDLPEETSSNFEEVETWLDKIDLKYTWPQIQNPIKREEVPEARVTAHDGRSFHPDANIHANEDNLNHGGTSSSRTSSQALSAAERCLLISDLKKPPNCPFSGEAHLFNRCYTVLSRRMRSLELDPWDELEILEAHTSVGSPPHCLIQGLACTIGADPRLVLEQIHKELQTRFGSKIEIASSLLHKVYQFPAIKGTENNLQTAESLRELCDLCAIIIGYMEDNSNLSVLDSSFGIAPVRNKLPTFLDNSWRRYKFESGSGKFADFVRFISNETEALYSDLRGQQAIERATSSGETMGKARAL